SIASTSGAPVALFLYRHLPYNTVNSVYRGGGSEVSLMISDELLAILVCPEDRSALELAESRLLDVVNGAIARGGVKNKGGEPVTEALQAALVRQDRAVLYPIVDRIPILLIDSGIVLEPVLKAPHRRTN